MRPLFIALSAALALLASATVAADMSEAEFIKQTYQNNLKEHAMAGLADAKASDSKVKEFASMLSKEHLKMNEELKTLAKSMNIQMPDYKDEKASYDKLANMKGREFDLAFLNWTIDSHEKELASFQAAQKFAKGDLKAFVDNHTPHIKQHLNKARDLSSGMTKGALRDVPVSEEPIDTSYNPEDIFSHETSKTGKTDGDLGRDMPSSVNETGHEMNELGRGLKQSIDKWK